jgi:hypothetical protein
VPTKIDINIYRIKFTLPNGQEVFFEKFLHNESIIFSLCNDDKSDCYIFPNYRYDKEKNNVCIDAILNNWNDVSFTIKKAINLASCIQDSNTNKFLSEECTAQYNSCSSN